MLHVRSIYFWSNSGNYIDKLFFKLCNYDVMRKRRLCARALSCMGVNITVGPADMSYL